MQEGSRQAVNEFWRQIRRHGIWLACTFRSRKKITRFRLSTTSTCSEENRQNGEMLQKTVSAQNFEVKGLNVGGNFAHYP